MIEGVVNAAYEAIITLPLRGPSGQAREIEAVIDTGYSGFLTLPPPLVAELELPFQAHGRLTLADGREETFDIYNVTMIWDGQPKHVDTYVVDAAPLVGMMLLDGHSLYVEIADGERVFIQAME